MYIGLIGDRMKSLIHFMQAVYKGMIREEF